MQAPPCAFRRPPRQVPSGPSSGWDGRHRADQSAFRWVVPSLAARAGRCHVRGSLTRRPPRTRSPATREPCPVKGRLLAPDYPAVAFRESPREPLPPERCVSPTSATDSPTSTLWTVRFPSAPREPRDPHVMLSYPRPMTSDSSSGRASLDGDAPASASQRHPEPAFSAEALKLARARTLRRPGGASIAAPLRWVSRRRRFQPHTELVAWPLTSSVAAIRPDPT